MTTPTVLPDDIIALLRAGSNAKAIKTLAEQRRTTILEARDTIYRWREERSKKIGRNT